eukprot:g18689.t1
MPSAETQEVVLSLHSVHNVKHTPDESYYGMATNHSAEAEVAVTSARPVKFWVGMESIVSLRIFLHPRQTNWADLDTDPRDAGNLWPLHSPNVAASGPLCGIWESAQESGVRELPEGLLRSISEAAQPPDLHLLDGGDRRPNDLALGSIGDLFTSLGAPAAELGKEFGELKDRDGPGGSRSVPQLLLYGIRLSVSRSPWPSRRSISRNMAVQRFPRSTLPTWWMDVSHDLRLKRSENEESSEKGSEKRSCVVVRNVVPLERAVEAKAVTEEYIAANREKLIGFPREQPMVWEVYWSKEQMSHGMPRPRMRQHQNMLATQTALNRLWHSANGEVDVDRPLTYCDRLRIRKAGDRSFTLGPHVDGGSTERWEDEEYRKVYRDILSGHWEQYDAFDATHRASARYDLQLGKTAGLLKQRDRKDYLR